ncbi:unnamed protein product [Durusdinium trenchii]|uniref:G domain-containing protein n=1 Tax=Durusdinium trenchii TaxID=1381693 RepID=A0ABP0L1L1_9DINO
MVRAEFVSLGVPEHEDVHGNDYVLPAMLVISVMLLLSRALQISLASCRYDRGEIPDTDNISRGVPFFLGALGNVLMKIASAGAHGLLAINWVLAGAEPGAPLVASFVLVAINTHMLYSVALVVHLRALLAAVAIQHHKRVHFQGITDLWGAPSGLTCLVLNGLSTALLLAALGMSSTRPERILTWLATAGGFLAWANSNFKSVGLMDSVTWKEIESDFDSKCVLPVAEFMRSLGVAVEKSGDSPDAPGRPLWLRMVSFHFNEDDELLLRHRPAVLRCAFPTSPRFRAAHATALMMLGLLSSAVPGLLVGFCWSRLPKLRDVELVGGTVFPELTSKRQDYYIEVEDSGSNGISMTFMMELGEASKYRFCCEGADCSDLQADDKSGQLRLKSMIAPHQFGTCYLDLRGLRSNRYNFTVLSLRHLSPRLNAEVDTGFQPFQPIVHSYHCDLVKPDKLTELILTSAVDLDPTRMHAEMEVSSSDGMATLSSEGEDPARSVSLHANLANLTGALNLSLLIRLRPADHELRPPKPELQSYQISASVVTVAERSRQLVGVIAELRAQIEANQETSSTVELAENLKKLDQAIRARDALLRRAYLNEKADASFVNSSQRLTFLAIGVTGTGKSELCKWLTGTKGCVSSDSMESNTSDVHAVQAHAFDDKLLQPKIEWIDTPGRGDTRGAEHDTRLWNQTMTQLLARGQSGSKIDCIVWVVNAAWQRATEVRNRMLKELRKSFGVDLYKNLVIMLNFLPHSANKTAYEEVKSRQKEKFVDWIMKREDEMFNWPGYLRKAVEEEVQSIRVYGADINPKYLKDKPSHVPVSAPYLSDFPPFSHPVGSEDLMKLIRDTWERKKSPTSGLLLDNPHPRIGPGLVENASLSLSCGWQKPQEGVRPSLRHQLIQQNLLQVEVHGSAFSAEDRALILPADGQECGQPDADDWDETLEQVVPSVPDTPENTSAKLQMEWSGETQQKLCFCEAPQCNESWRFGQEQVFPEKDCQPIRKHFEEETRLKVDTPGFENVDLCHLDSMDPPWFLATVGERMFGIPSSETCKGHVLEFRSSKGHQLVPKRHEIPLSKQKDRWRGPGSVVGRYIYAIDMEGQRVLVVDVNEDSLSMNWFKTFKDDAPEAGSYYGIAATETSVYLVPGSAEHVRIYDLESKGFRDRALPQDWEKHSSWHRDEEDCIQPKGSYFQREIYEMVLERCGTAEEVQGACDHFYRDQVHRSLANMMFLCGSKCLYDFDHPSHVAYVWDEDGKCWDYLKGTKPLTKFGHHRRTSIQGECNSAEVIQQMVKRKEKFCKDEEVPNLTRKKPKQKQEKLPDAFGLTKSFTKVEDDALDVQKEPKFAAPCMADSKLFAPPWEMFAYLVMDEKETLHLVETKRFFNSFWGWSQFVESNGRIYGAPYFARGVLVIPVADFHQPEFLDISEVSTQRAPFTGVALGADASLFFTPGLGGEPLLLSKKTKLELWALPLPEPPEEKQKKYKFSNKGGTKSSNRPQMQRNTRPQMQRNTRPQMQRNTRRPPFLRNAKKVGKKTTQSAPMLPAAHELEPDRDIRIEKIQRNIVALGEKLYLSPGKMGYMLSIDTSVGIKTE